MASLAIANLRLRKLRTAISIAAVAVGIMTLVVLRGLVEGTIGEVADRMNSVRADLLVWDKSHNTFMHGHTMSAKYAATIRRMDGVAQVVPVLNDSISLGGQAQTIYAVPASNFEMFGGEERLAAGRLFKAGTPELIVDTRLVNVHEGGLHVGDAVEHRGETFTVVGIVAEGVVGRVFMSYETADALWHSDERRANLLFVRLASPADAERVGQEIRRLGLIVVDKGNYYNVIAKDATFLEWFVWTTAALTLLVSFLTVSLTIFTIVQEQTREVGILKSLGATRGFIMRLVIAQSLIICSAGVLLGFVMSLGAKLVIKPAVPLLTVSLHPGLLATAVGVGLLGGLVGALYPAWRAARLDPVETLSYE